jgi:hypothetical protein
MHCRRYVSKTCFWVCFLAVSLCTQQIAGQEPDKPKVFVPRLGLSIYGASKRSGGEGAILPGLSFYPGFRLYQQKNVALSIGMPLSFAAWNTESDWMYGWNAGLTADLHFGYGANDESKKGVGFLMGGGIGHTYVYNEGYINNGEIAFGGPRLHTAFVFRGDKEGETAVMIWLQWQTNFDKSNKKDIWGVGLALQVPN